MAPLIRKVLIYSAIEGLVLQAHGATEHHKAICVDYQNHAFAVWNKSAAHLPKDEPRLESHGILGLINIASLSFLVAITKREQVAQIYGKPIFVITDVALLPLSSQHAAREAMHAAANTHSADDLSNSDYSDEDEDEEHHHATPGAEIFTPLEENTTSNQTKSTNTSIAEDVARRKASYGKFASEWFSKRVWGPNKVSRDFQTAAGQRSEPSALDKKHSGKAVPTGITVSGEDSTSGPAENKNVSQTASSATHASTLSLLPKILRSIKLILGSRSFYFSYDFDLTRRLSLLDGRQQVAARESLDPLYFWNRRIGSSLIEGGHDSFLLPIIQGFVGQRTFSVRRDEKCPVDKEEMETSSNSNNSEQTYLLTLISRRSTRRSGLRYLRRGIDDEGDCANSAETEQILSAPDWSKERRIHSFVQMRGSIPLYFSQSPYSFKPVPTLHNSLIANQNAFKKHFQGLKERYGNVQIVMLVDKHNTEASIGEAYERTYKTLHDDDKLDDVAFEWFDFHAECRGMKFENVERLVNKLKYNIAAWGNTVISQEKITRRQSGIIRTNCMDCLDRTNVAQSAFGQYVLQRQLKDEGFEIDLVHDESTNWFNTLWADNGDAISRQYASTAALKGDFTRTRKRNWQGAVNDLGLTLSRYYSNMVNDYFSQAVIDLLLKNVSWRVFEDFESTMMSADPGISVSSAREAAIENCAKIVIQHHDEDLIHGWTLLSPAQENTLRTLPLEETVVLLTDAAVYCCKFDWNTEKVASFEKVDLRSISKIRHGTYVTSTFTQRQIDEQFNQGLVLIFTPGKDNVIRVNTRSLQNNVTPESNPSTVDGGTGLLSWFTPGLSKANTRTMALKIIPEDINLQAENQEHRRVTEQPRALAERISDEIRRAIEGQTGNLVDSNLVEEGDIISAADARSRTGYLEQLSHSIRRMVWT